MYIGQNIKKRRCQLGMSQQQLADSLGYKTRSSIAKIEKGITDISQARLESFANVLNTTAQFLITGIGNQQDHNNSIILESPYHKGSILKSSIHDVEKLKCQFTDKVIAVVLAGGKLSLGNQNVLSQFINVNGKPVIMYVLEKYQMHPAVDYIYVVCAPGWERIVTAYSNQYGISKFVGTIPSGETGALSLKSAVEWLSSKCNKSDTVIFQEATRPLVSEDTISNVICCTKENGSAITFEPMDEYMQFIMTNNLEVEYVDRSKLLSIQSPEAYCYQSLHQTFLEAKKMQYEFKESCCAMFMHNMGRKLVFVEGNRYNLKIARSEDINILEALLNAHY